MVGFAFALPTLRLDSRLRGNDRAGAVRLRRTGGLGLRVRNSLESLFDKEGLREFGGIRGLKRAPREGRWVSRPLYPHYTWIPASAGMTEVEKGDSRDGR
jgi:hypothetical protein